MKIAIIGSGFFGTALALTLSKYFKIDLYEKSNTILNGASRANQMRYHLGFHYPRSLKTINEIKKADKFNKENNYFYNFTEKTYNYYGIANSNSKINFKNYLNILKRKNLNYKIKKKIIYKSIINNFILSNEFNLNFKKFEKYIKYKINKNKNINLFLNKKFSKSYLKKYDKIFLTAYSNNNTQLNYMGFKKLKKYKYELVEKIIVKLPKKYKKKSYVIIDGKFCNIDPFLGTDFHLLSDVKFSKIESLTGYFPKFKSKEKVFLNKGIIKNKKISKFNEFIKRSSVFLPFLKYAKYKGSIYSVRTLNIKKERTDERSTELNFYGKKIICINSSKWNMSYFISHKILSELIKKV